MAISKIKPRHTSADRSITTALKARLDYDKNPGKTDGGLLVTGHQCSPVSFSILFTAERLRMYSPQNIIVKKKQKHSATAPAYHIFCAPNKPGIATTDNIGNTKPLPKEIGKAREALAIEVKKAADTTFIPIKRNPQE